MDDNTSIGKGIFSIVGKLAFSAGVVMLIPWIFNLSSCSPTRLGPDRIVSLGVVRFTECKYKGDFVGGAGFLCTAKNVSTNEPRQIENMRCAGYDKSDRLVSRPSDVYDLDGQIISPSEERVITVYGPDESSILICSETGDLIGPTQLPSIMQQLQAKNLVSDLSI